MSGTPRLQAVVFDFDGIVVDTEPLHYASFQAVLEKDGLGYSWEVYCEDYIGMDDRDSFRTTYARAGTALGPDELKARIYQKARDFEQRIANMDLEAYPGVVSLVRQIHASLPLGLCSGAVRSDILPILTRLECIDCFDVMVTAEDVAQSKPDPESYRVTLKRLSEKRGESLEPSACLAIEDTPAGIASAQGAGMKVLGVTTTHQADQLTTADWVVESLEAVSLAKLTDWMATQTF